MSERTGITVVGTGRMAQALLRALAPTGERPLHVTSRDPGRAARLASRLPGVRSAANGMEAALGSRITILAVPDRAVGKMAADWARRGADWSGRVVLHCAGSLGLDALTHLERAGASVGVLHPYQALGVPRRGAELLRGSWARVEGRGLASRAAKKLARTLGLRPIRFQSTKSDPVAYHASASLASNDLVALLSLAEHTLLDAGARPGDARGAVASIARGALEQFEGRGIDSVTGPVIRGDCPTVEAHLVALDRIDPGAVAAHAALGHWLLRHAAALPVGARRRMARVLRRGYGVGTKV